MQDDLARLRALAARHADGLGRSTAIPGLSLNAATEPTTPQLGVLQPMVCLILQGAKQVRLGAHTLRYDSANYLLAALEGPASGCIIEATPERPYLSLSIALDRDALAELAPDTQSPAALDDDDGAAFVVSPITPPLVSAAARLAGLIETPHDIPVLAPLFTRELYYRLMQGPRGNVLRQIARADSRLSQVRRAIAWIRDNFDQTIRVETLAELAGMSPASFHRHFKTATAMSPLAFQKSLRLQHARRLLASSQEVARVGYTVGYESASQFSREYARLFGMPPARDALRLRTGMPLPDVNA
ncbi:MAG: AraC family transcriptional regulator [Hyphomonadaceae bacterium]|nr:AraC family transcriptional regulator [Hyphomonadaceae bacterium]